ncbi:hypothetical protein GCM10027060_18940 [Nesterenkonia halophila]
MLTPAAGPGELHCRSRIHSEQAVLYGLLQGLAEDEARVTGAGAGDRIVAALQADQPCRHVTGEHGVQRDILPSREDTRSSDGAVRVQRLRLHL